MSTPMSYLLLGVPKKHLEKQSVWLLKIKMLHFHTLARLSVRYKPALFEVLRESLETYTINNSHCCHYILNLIYKRFISSGLHLECYNSTR